MVVFDKFGLNIVKELKGLMVFVWYMMVKNVHLDFVKVNQIVVMMKLKSSNKNNKLMKMWIQHVY